MSISSVNHTDGEAWHRHGRLHPGSHQQHLPKELRECRQRPASGADQFGRGFGAWLSEGWLGYTA